jgi:hypothetical protein
VHEFERGLFKIAGLGILGVVAYDALTHSDGVVGIVKAVLGSYNTTLATIAGK